VHCAAKQGVGMAHKPHVRGLGRADIQEGFQLPRRAVKKY